MLPLHLGIGAAYHGFLGGALLAVGVPLAVGAALSLAFDVSTLRSAAPTGVLLLGGAFAFSDAPVLFAGEALLLAALAYLVVPYGISTAIVRAGTREPLSRAFRGAAVGAGVVLGVGTVTGAIVDPVVGTTSLFGVRWFVGYLVVLADAGVLAGALVVAVYAARYRFPQD